MVVVVVCVPLLPAASALLPAEVEVGTPMVTTQCLPWAIVGVLVWRSVHNGRSKYLHTFTEIE